MIIGLGHKKYAGKDEVGRYLHEQHGFQRLAFADNLKLAAEAIWGFSYEQVFGAFKDVVDPYWGFAPSSALQKLGTEVVRGMDPDTWVKSLERTIIDRELGERDLCITDMRFPNECAMIQRLGGFAVEVFAPVEVREERAKTLGVSVEELRKRYTHASETALDGFQFDALIMNDGPVGDLHESIEGLLRELKLRDEHR